MTIHGRIFSDFAENQATDQFVQQNKKLLKVNMGYGPVLAKVGSMVAYQGDMRFENKGDGGLGRMLKKAVTHEGVEMMTVAGQGDLFLADGAQDIQIFYLENDAVSVNGPSVLAFSSSISWDIRRVQGAGALSGGLFNVLLQGTGFVAVLTDGEPVALDISTVPTFADPQAAVMWTAGVQVGMRTDFTGGLKSIVRGGTGEGFQLSFTGQGMVLIQPSEGRGFLGGGGGSQAAQGSGGMLGGLLG